MAAKYKGAFAKNGEHVRGLISRTGEAMLPMDGLPINRPDGINEAAPSQAWASFSEDHRPVPIVFWLPISSTA